MSDAGRAPAARALDAPTPDAVSAALGRGDGVLRGSRDSYYGLPVVRASHWGWEIATYFWIGGIMSGSAVLALLGEHVAREPDAALVRNGRVLAVAGAALSGLLLVKDLSRPERFLNMLRILKLKSPMSVGAWGLTAFSLAGGAALSDQLRRDGVLPFDPFAIVPRLLRDAAFAGTGGLMASYTGVLVSATAIPVWYRGRRFIPAIFVASATASSCAANALVLAVTGRARRDTLERLERIESIAGVCELALLLAYERVVGADAAPLFDAPVGKRVKNATMLGGIVVPLALTVLAKRLRGPAPQGRDVPGPSAPRDASGLDAPPRHAVERAGFGTCVRTIVGAVLTLRGAYVLRDAVLEAGRRSAADPKPVLQAPDAPRV